MLTPDEAAGLLRSTRQAIYRRIRRRTLPAIKDGRRTLIPRAAVDAILRGRREAADERESDRGLRGQEPRMQGKYPCKERQNWFSIRDCRQGTARWAVNFYLYDGRTRPLRLRRRSPHTSMADTQRWAQQLLSDLGSPPESQAPPTPTLALTCDRWLATQDRDLLNKTRHLRWLVLAWGADNMIDALDHEQITGLPARLNQPCGEPAKLASRKRRGEGSGRRRSKGKGLGASTIRAVCQTASRVLDFATQMGWRSAAKIPLPKVAVTDSEWLTIEELESLLAIAGQHRIAYMLGARAGLRRGEIVELRWKDVDLVNARIRVARAYKRLDNLEWMVGPPKGGRPRTVPIPRDLVDALAEIAGSSEDLVARTAEGERIEPWRLSESARQDAAKAGIPRTGIGAHTLRHTYCSHLAQGGASTRAIQMLAGHASMRTTERYMHLAPSHVEGAIAHLPPLGGSVETLWKPSRGAAGAPKLRLV